MSRDRRLLVAALVLVLPPFPLGAAPENLAASAASPHVPILIDGDADLCDDEDGDGRPEGDDGIVNCGTADGTPERPYVIEGWSIQSGTDSVCASIAPAPITCDQGAVCATGRLIAAVHVCDLTRSLVLRKLTIRNLEQTYSSTSTENSTDLTGAGIGIERSTSVRVEDVVIESAAHALAVIGTPEAPASAVVRGLTTAPSLATAPPSQAVAFSLPPILAHNADLDVEGAAIDTTGRSTSIRADGSEAALAGRPTRVRLAQMHVGNFTTRALYAVGTWAEVRESVFQGAPAPSTLGLLGDGLASSVMTLGESPFLVEGNAFLLTGPASVAITVEGNASGLVRLNRFEQSGREAYALVHLPDAGCFARAEYNDFADLHVANHDLECVFDARRNWWGRPAAPEPPPSAPGSTADKILVVPWLSVPPEDLPSLTIEAPGEGAGVTGTATLRGRATGTSSNTPKLVEASRQLDPWSVSTSAPVESGQWTAQLDVSREPIGTLVVWLRPCGSAECGVPVALELRVVPRALAPIAILDATPRVARADEPVTLSGASSYSPEGRKIVSYAFDAGDGSPPTTSDRPDRTVAYAEPGLYTATLRVRDEGGLESANIAETTVRVIHEPEAIFSEPLVPAALSDVPGAGALLVAAAAAGSAALVRRRRE